MRLELSYLSNFCDKRPDESNIGKEEVIGAHYLRCTASRCRRHGGRVWDYRSECFPIQGAERHECWYSCMLAVYLVQNPSLQSRVTHSQVVFFFFILVKSLCQTCHRNHKKFVSQITLNPIKLTIKIDSHTGTMIQLTYQGSISEHYCTR